jgi:transcriptional regulator with XRE-family HTH domain
MSGVEAAQMLRQARRDAGLTQRELAARAGTSQAAIAAVESGRKQPTAATLSRWLELAGAGLGLRSADELRLERRGEDLVQVLRLAQALPGRRRGELRYPRVPA